MPSKILSSCFLLLALLSFGSSNLMARDLAFSTACNPKNEEVVLSFVGDILIHKALYKAVVSETKHFSQLWKKAEPLFKKADFSVANLEGPAALGIDKNGKDRGDVGFIYDDDVYSGTNFIFNFHPRIFSDLLESGFDLVTSANNHAADRYSIGIDRTIIAARNAKMPTVGTRKSDEANGEYYKIVQIKNMRIAFLGCTEFINQPDRQDQVLLCESDKVFKIIKDVSARPDVDAVVLLPHWGVEYSTEPRQYQKEYARRYLEAGAIAVIGSHPHVLQTWEKYTTQNGRETLIIYSLGNFIAGQDSLPRKAGTVAYMGLSKNGTQKAKLFGVAYTPTYRIDTQVTPLSKNDNPEILSHIASYYGLKGRVEPKDSLSSVICTK